MARLLFVFAICVTLTASDGFAQPETAPLVVMNLAAHPDDEDGSTLAYYRHAKNAIAYSVIFTRGEGGQNEIGPELYEELGALRTTETERAARHLGTQVFFLNFKDFGYSKTAEETYDRWGGKDDVTAQLVYFVRKLKPDVLFTNHDTVTVAPARQHGHHQAVGVSAFEAFELAADPTYHPEQLEEEGVDLWQPKRLFRRLWSSNGSHDVAVPIGDRDKDAGISYAAIAARALHEHASQGMDMFAERVAAWDSTYFVEYRNATDAPLDREDLAGNLPPNTSAEPDVTYWIDSGRIEPMSIFSLGDHTLVPGQKVALSWDRSRLPSQPIRLIVSGAVDTTLIIREDSRSVAQLVVDRAAAPTIPQKVFQYHRFRSGPPIVYAVYDAQSSRLQAAGYLDAEIAPPVYLETEADVARLDGGLNTIPYRLRVYDEQITQLTLGAAVSADAASEVLDQRQERLEIEADELRNDSVPLRLPATPQEGRYTVALTAHAPQATSGPAKADAFLPARVFSVNVPDGLRVGVVQSYDNTLAHALSELDVDHVLLDSLDLAEGSLEDLHTIVVDIRAYLVRRDLRMHNERLLDWVRRGGHLIVNYQKTFEWNADSPDPFDPARNNPGNFAPYPLDLGRDRVTLEDAPVTAMADGHPMLERPNAIDDSAWEGWVQERGLYFPERYDERYQELFSLQDPGEEPLTGSTLLADVGEGTYLYTALVWYRQLKEYHPGAYRMFANMISLPLADDRTAGP